REALLLRGEAPSALRDRAVRLQLVHDAVEVVLLLDVHLRSELRDGDPRVVAHGLQGLLGARTAAATAAPAASVRAAPARGAARRTARSTATRGAAARTAGTAARHSLQSVANTLEVEVLVVQRAKLLQPLLERVTLLGQEVSHLFRSNRVKGE